MLRSRITTSAAHGLWLALPVFLLALSAPAMASVVLQINPANLPNAAFDPVLTVRFHGEPEPVVLSSFTEGGVPYIYSFVFDCNSGPATWIEQLELSFECGDEFPVYTVNPAPWSMPCSADYEIQLGVIDFGTDPEQDCWASYFDIDDLRIQVEGPMLRLDWTHIWGYEGYRVYQLEYPGQPLHEGVMLSEQWDNSLQVPLQSGTAMGFFRVVTLYE